MCFISEGSVEWISRPRSRLFVNAGQTARIKWKFPAGAMAITYEKKTTISGDKTRIAYKEGAANPVILDGYKGKIRIEKSGALSVLKAGLKDEGYYGISIVYKSNTLVDEVEIMIQGNIYNDYTRNNDCVEFYSLSSLCNLMNW